MFYITLADITGLIPEKFLIEALDDDADGQADTAVINEVLKAASDAVDTIIGGRYTTPLSNPLPVVAIGAAKVFAAELCYTRRGRTPDQNPFAKQADQQRKILGEIAAGDKPLSPVVKKASSPGKIITEPSKTSSATGKLST